MAENQNGDSAGLSAAAETQLKEGARLMERKDRIKLFTIGYEGKRQDEVIDRLKSAHVKLLVDVRDVAGSRKKGFSKSQLAASLEEAGIAYEHLRELGCPRSLRNEYRQTGDFSKLASGYLDHLQASPESLQSLTDLVHSSSICLLCFEESASQCHRSLLAEEVAGAERGAVEVIHL